jgi:PTH1 family peptidyl-tRNA hydrolase
MKIMIGLGNPGREYAGTRHNVGFMVVTEIAKRAAITTTRKRLRSDLAEGSLDGERIILAAPQTYMNLSGHAVREILNWYRVELDDVLVVLDEMDLPFGQLRMRAKGSAGGHNGLASIIDQLGTDEIPRLRIGIGRPRSVARSHVLSRFSPEETRVLSDVIGQAADAVQLWLRDGIIAAMNDVNRRPASGEDPPPSAEAAL